MNLGWFWCLRAESWCLRVHFPMRFWRWRERESKKQVNILGQFHTDASVLLKCIAQWRPSTSRVNYQLYLNTVPATCGAFSPAHHNDESPLVLGRKYLERLGNIIIMHSGLAWVELHSWPSDICNSNWNQTKMNHHNMKETKKNYWALTTLFYSVGPRAVAVLIEAPLSSHQSHFYRELPAVLSCLL